MKPKDVRRFLLSIPAPDELEAQRRAWPVVQAAFAERERIAWPRRHARPLLAFAVVLALLAAALTPPGRAVVREVREAIGLEEVGRKDAAPALFRLPAPGKLLVTSGRGVWLVQRDGSKRLLGRYREASFSPTGLFVAVARRNELVALDPRSGDLRWSLPRVNVRFPRWHGSRVDTRIAYLSDGNLRVVAGDGTGDRVLARDVQPIEPTWRPGAGFVVVYRTGGRITAVDADSRKRLWRSAGVEAAQQLAWSADGRRLLVVKRHGFSVYDARGRLRASRALPGRLVLGSFSPKGHRFALVRMQRGRSELLVLDADRPRGRAQRAFSGRGRFRNVVWSPDGRWLLLTWETPDQWLFIRSGVEKIDAVGSISPQFRSSTFPALEGWCCP
jgi:hypothetical protein